MKRYKVNIKYEPIGIKNGINLRELYNKLRFKYCINSFTKNEAEKVLGKFSNSFEELLKDNYIVEDGK